MTDNGPQGPFPQFSLGGVPLQARGKISGTPGDVTDEHWDGHTRVLVRTDAHPGPEPTPLWVEDAFVEALRAARGEHVVLPGRIGLVDAGFPSRHDLRLCVDEPPRRTSEVVNVAEVTAPIVVTRAGRPGKRLPLAREVFQRTRALGPGPDPVFVAGSEAYLELDWGQLVKIGGVIDAHGRLETEPETLTVLRDSETRATVCLGNSHALAVDGVPLDNRFEMTGVFTSIAALPEYLRTTQQQVSLRWGLEGSGHTADIRMPSLHTIGVHQACEDSASVATVEGHVGHHPETLYGDRPPRWRFDGDGQHGLALTLDGFAYRRSWAEVDLRYGFGAPLRFWHPRPSDVLEFEEGDLVTVRLRPLLEDPDASYTGGWCLEDDGLTKVVLPARPST